MKKSFFTFGGLLLLSWSLINSYVDINRYGWDTGIYWWFCNLALFGTGLGLLIRSRGLLTGFLAIAIFTQVFWLIDNIARQVQGHGIFGLIDFRYQAGYPLDEFILSHYHYFPIPVAFVALFFLPQTKNHTLKLIAFFNPFIFGVSYFAFSSSQNINCIHRACFPGLVNWNGPLYSFLFWGVIFLIHLALGRAIDRFFLGLHISPLMQQRALAGLGIVCMFGVGVAVRDTHYKLSLPAFACDKPTREKDVVSGCVYTRVMPQNQTMVTYYLENQASEARFCRVHLLLGEKDLMLSEGVTVSDNARVEQNGIFDNPTENVVGKIVSDCSPMPTRINASIQ